MQVLIPSNLQESDFVAEAVIVDFNGGVNCSLYGYDGGVAVVIASAYSGSSGTLVLRGYWDTAFRAPVYRFEVYCNGTVNWTYSSMSAQVVGDLNLSS